MKFEHRLLRRLTLLLAVLMLLTGCRQQVVEKVGVLPDRPTQFVAHNSETEETAPEGKSWDVQNVDELRLFASEMDISTRPSAHYFDNIAYLYRTTMETDDRMLYSLERIEADGSLTLLHTSSIQNGNYCYYSPDGTTAAYETWINNCLTLMLVDLKTNEERVLWQSDEASILTELGISVKLICQWSPDGSTLLFIPICYINETAINLAAANDSGTVSDSSVSPETTEQDSSVITETALESEPEVDEAAAQESIPEADSQTPEESAAESTDESTAASEEKDNDEPVDLIALSSAEKMQLVYETLPNFPLIYAYQIEQKNMQSFLIALEDYALYDSESTPMICANQDGSHFFIYFNSPTDPGLAHYVDLPGMLHYSTPLTYYLSSFTHLGSEPLFYNNLLYLHVDSVGIMVLDPGEGTLKELYPFNDPIHSFTIYDNALIVAQPSSVGGGVDVTAYLLNLDTKQSVLLYHNNETYSPFINHMEMSQDGKHLLIEQLPSEYHTQKQLIQLSFN